MQINFSAYNFTIRTNEDQSQIFDIVRRKYVALTPEEWVRQHLLHYFIFEFGFPKSLISVEKQLLLNGLRKRTDIVLYNRKAAPMLIVECKAPEVNINEDVVEQAARYNLTLQVPFLMLSNGSRHVLSKIDHNNKSWDILEALPPVAEILDL